MEPSSIHFSASEDHHHSLSHDIHNPSSQPPPPPHAFGMATLSSHPTAGLSAETNESILQQHLQSLGSLSGVPVTHSDFAQARHSPRDSFEHERPSPAATSAPMHCHSTIALPHPSHTLPHPHPHSHHTPPSPLRPPAGPPGQHQFSLLAPSIPLPQPDNIAQNSPAENARVYSVQPQPPPLATVPESPPEQRPHGQLVNRIVIDPPNLQAWREKLFSVDDTITLSNDEFETYFPHIDNVYSHRSTQKYKRKNFISHYWDCRMKGRPPGTPKSDDPTKKKRKRFARERDLCDVKIKITEYFPDATFAADGTINASPTGGCPSLQQFQDGTVRPPISSSTATKYWTIQRVNGNGGNGKGDGVPGPHKHTLQKSDEIKKSTVQRFIAAQEKNMKKGQNPVQQKRPSGNALMTARKHSKEHPLKLYAASFCPFSQRVWIALEAKGMPYQYCETDPFKRPTHLLEANPRGLVPAIRQGDWASGESTVILEYLEDYDGGVPLLPTDPRLKANCRLWIDHINAKIVPAFFALMRIPDPHKQTDYTDKLQSDVLALVQAADERGPYFLGGDLCLVDIHFAPFVLRMSRILREFCNWRGPMPGTRWQQWADSLERNPHVKATTSQDELYIETVDLFVGAHPPYGEHTLY